MYLHKLFSKELLELGHHFLDHLQPRGLCFDLLKLLRPEKQLGFTIVQAG